MKRLSKDKYILKQILPPYVSIWDIFILCLVCQFVNKNNYIMTFVHFSTYMQNESISITVFYKVTPQNK